MVVGLLPGGKETCQSALAALPSSVGMLASSVAAGGEGAEVPGDDVEGELGAPVLVEESLVVEGPWPSEGAGGGVGSAVDELPEGDAVEPRGLGEDGRPGRRRRA